MAYIRAHEKAEFVGLSTDTKPTLEAKDAGSRLYESDTLSWYIWNSSAWVLLPPALHDAFIVRKTITYDGSASYNAFTTTGAVAVKILGYIETALSNVAATTSVGTATSAAGLIAATAGTALQTEHQIFVDNSPSKFETFPANYIAISENIVVDGDATLAAGEIILICFWKPITSGSLVVAA